MSRRIALPGADELFRATGDGTRATEEPRSGLATAPNVTEPDAGLTAVNRTLRTLETHSLDTADARPQESSAGVAQDDREAQDEQDDLEAAAGSLRPPSRRRARALSDRRPSGRERHDEKITVYVSPDELMDLEHARLALRGDHGLSVDRGRVVREALAVVLADFEAKGEASILVRRLRGR